MLVETTFHLIAAGRVADVSAWTKHLRIIPSHSARRGDRAGTCVSPDSWWAIVLDKHEASGVEEPLLQLLKILLPFKREIAVLVASENLEVTVTSYVWDHGQNPVADLSAITLGSLHQLGCSYSAVAYD